MESICLSGLNSPKDQRLSYFLNSFQTLEMATERKKNPEGDDDEQRAIFDLGCLKYQSYFNCALALARVNNLKKSCYYSYFTPLIYPIYISKRWANLLFYYNICKFELSIGK